jgi:hypothetical protein
MVGGAAADTFNLGSGTSSVTGAAGADQININHGGLANVTSSLYGANATAAGAAGVNMDTINNFTTTVDKINLSVFTITAANSTNGVAGTALTTVAAMNAVIADVASVATIANVYTQLAADLTAGTFAASVTGANGIVARAVSFANGAAAGTYLVVNDGAAGFQAGTDMVVRLTGLTTVAAGDFAYTYTAA